MVRKKAPESPSGHVQNILPVMMSLQYQSKCIGTAQGIFRGSKGERAIAYALLEVTSPEAALTRNDVTTAKFLPTWGFNQRYWPGL
jgi:hypothetical protein